MTSNISQHSNIVLLVDDNEMDLELNELAIRRLGKDLVTRKFKNGKKVIEYLKSSIPVGEMPFMMILDLNMPVMNGFKVLESIQDNGLKKFPVIILSSSSLHEDQVRARQLGADECCEKPMGYRDNISLFKRLVNKYHSSQQITQPNKI